MVEFVKGDTHGSKAVPPRFKDHTKLVCARHSRSGRKKYVKKHPDRVRKVPSRKVRMVWPVSASLVAAQEGEYFANVRDKVDRRTRLLCVDQFQNIFRHR